MSKHKAADAPSSVAQASSLPLDSVSSSENLFVVAAPAPTSAALSVAEGAAVRAPLPTVTEVRATCPRCKGLKHKVLDTRAFPGRPMTLPDGRRHTGIRLQRRRCLACARTFNVRQPLVEA